MMAQELNLAPKEKYVGDGDNMWKMKEQTRKEEIKKCVEKMEKVERREDGQWIRKDLARSGKKLIR